MNKFEIAIAIITGVCLVGVIALIGFGKDTVILMPILTALVGWILGKKEETVLKAFRK